ncbi:MAG: hypothetical protein IJ946_07175 [Clostridia bacterium]|nr:hypothetical protein [Clostridia bacterium]
MNGENNKQLVLKDGVLYEGEVFADVPHGYGKANYGDGCYYEGNWDCGKRSGKGIKRYTDSIYEGEWRNDKRNGFGKLIWDKGGEWIGEFKDDKYWCGSGRKYYTDSYYDGEIKNGERDGRGKIVWNNGGEWEGIFKNDKYWCGTGRRYYTDSYFDGEVVEGKRNGLGKLVWNSGGEWNGEYKDDLRWCGSGKIYDDLGVFDGEIKEGKQNGNGKYIYHAGGEWSGEYKDNNKWNGSGIIKHKDSVYDGEIKNGEKYIGKLIWNAGGEWEGEFKNGLPWTGNGKIWFSDKEYYEGELLKGQKHGQGMQMTYEILFKGEYRNNDLYRGEGCVRYANGLGKYTGQIYNNGKHGRGIIQWHDGTEWVGEFRNNEPWEGSGNWCFEDGSCAFVEYQNGKLKSNNGCYIATAVYGSYDCPEVWVLRRFRDYTLAETKYGRTFIKIYYAISPILVKWFGETRWFKCLWRSRLDKMIIKLQEKGIDSSPYEDRF